jgi:thiol:disulfide interchange protein DsbG
MIFKLLPIRALQTAALAFLTAAMLSPLVACNDAPSPTANASKADKSAARPVSIAAIAAEATGFTVGSTMSARTVYVFFDAQCSHCSELWRSARPLQSKAKFVWIPVGLLNAASTAQGATLLAAADAPAAMDRHEASMTTRGGGITAGSDIDTQKAAVAKNTALHNQFGFTSIPAIVAMHAQTGALVTHEGAMTTAALSTLLGFQ